MYQGTTPTHTFKVKSPVAVDLLEDIKIFYIQSKRILLTKEKKDCTIIDNEIRVDLSQEETLSFSHLIPLRIEGKALTPDKKVIGFVIENVSVERMINKEVFII